MTKCTPTTDLFPACKSRKIEVDFNGGDITSDAGSLLIRQADRKLGLTRDLNKVLDDPRRKASCDHTQVAMWRQRIYGLALGYEDLNDHATLRDDLALQTAVESRGQPSIEHLTDAGGNSLPKPLSGGTQFVFLRFKSRFYLCRQTPQLPILLQQSRQATHLRADRTSRPQPKALGNLPLGQTAETDEHACSDRS